MVALTIAVSCLASVKDRDSYNPGTDAGPCESTQTTKLAL